MKSVNAIGTPLTEAGTFLGTLGYAAPEQLNSRDADSRSDLFALGAVLYEMLSGTPAFYRKHDRHGTVMATLLNHPARFAEHVPDDLQTIVFRCLEKLPEKRPETAAEIVHELDRILKMWSAETAPIHDSSLPPLLADVWAANGMADVVTMWPGQERVSAFALLRKRLRPVCAVDVAVSLIDFWEGVAESCDARNEDEFFRNLKREHDREPRVLLAGIQLPRGQWSTFEAFLGRLRRHAGIALLQVCNPIHGPTFDSSSLRQMCRVHHVPRANSPPINPTDWGIPLSELRPCCRDTILDVMAGREERADRECVAVLVKGGFLIQRKERLTIPEPGWRAAWSEQLERR